MKSKYWKVRQGEIYDVDLPVSVGSVQSGIRPMVITSANRRNRRSPTVIAVVVTSQIKRLDLAEHVLLPDEAGLPKRSMICAEQRFTIDKRQLLRKRGKLTWPAWNRVRRALRQSERSYKRDYEREE